MKKGIVFLIGIVIVAYLVLRKKREALDDGTSSEVEDRGDRIGETIVSTTGVTLKREGYTTVYASPISRRQ